MARKASKADFTGARLNQAALSQAKFQGAHFRCAKTGRESGTGCAELRGADLSDAQLEAADLSEAQLQGANLSNAQFQGADLPDAHLQGAHLRDAQLQGANLRLAQLQGADLEEAQLQAAFLFGALLQGADLHNAHLQGAELSYAELQGADLSVAHLQGANLNNAKLQGVNLFNASLQGANLFNAHLQGTGFRMTRIWRVNGGETRPHSVITSLSNTELADFQGCDPDTKPWTDGGNGPHGFVEWRDLILKEVPGKARNEAENRLSTVDPSSKTLSVIGRRFWLWKAASPKGETTDAKLAAFLGNLACSPSSAPYVARGILTNGNISDMGSQTGTFVERLLVGKSDPTTCPGVAGFTNKDWAQLDQLVQDDPDSETKSKPTSNPNRPLSRPHGRCRIELPTTVLTTRTVASLPAPASAPRLATAIASAPLFEIVGRKYRSGADPEGL